MFNLNLGIIYDENGNAQNHRSLLKVALNPFLRAFGCQITSCWDFGANKILGYELRKCEKIPLLKGLKSSWLFVLSKNWRLKKIKRLF